ncbi:MAG TPA: alpha/beta hydrolase-fold protein [Solirubrobacteraceae bacterium]|nr:alpha/beta hydrolase-fold protein [Solirubrobacteraceae bacterium]
MTGGPEVHPDRVVFRLEDAGFSSVRLQQELERPRSGPGFARSGDGHWEVEYRRPQVDRMEYRIEADGESFCDPHNPLRAPGAFGDKSVVEFPGYVPPAWLAAPEPEPATPIAERVALWSPPDTDPRQPLPLLIAHDGGEYERLSGLTKLVNHAIATARLPPCRVALLDPVERNETYSASTRYARRLASTVPQIAPATAIAGLGASLGALALLHTRWLHPGAFGALMLQSGSFFRLRWDRQESGFPRFRRISRFVGQVLHAGPAVTPIPITVTCGAPEENLANNRAVATALRRQGHAVTLHVNRDGHNYVGWRDTLDPHLVELLARAWG